MKKGIMQILEEYKNDTRNEKLNLALGIYMDNSGNSPIFDVVKKVEHSLIFSEITKGRFNILGSDEFRFQAKKMLFPKFSAEERKKILLIQTVGSSGSLSIVASTIAKKKPKATVWLSNPTWENHEPIFSNNINEIKYYNYSILNNKLDLNRILKDLSKAKEGDIILFHACCHNPTGIDCNNDEWKVLAEYCDKKKLIPLFDFAYQGYRSGVIEDAEVFNIFNNTVDEFIVCSSFSKNMGLYDERVGTLSLIFNDSNKCSKWENEIREMIRSTYSIPPTHGSKIVTAILSDSLLYKQWIQELEGIRGDIVNRRNKLINMLEELEIAEKFLNYRDPKGMFICLTITQEEIDQLRDNYGIYILDSGRISIASINDEKIQYLCNTLKKLK